MLEVVPIFSLCNFMFSPTVEKASFATTRLLYLFYIFMINKENESSCHVHIINSLKSECSSTELQAPRHCQGV